MSIDPNNTKNKDDTRYHDYVRRETVKSKPSFISKMSWQTIFSLALLVIFLIFAVINLQYVTLNIIFRRIEVPLIVIILSSAAVGVVFAWMARWRYRRKKAKKYRWTRKTYSFIMILWTEHLLKLFNRGCSVRRYMYILYHLILYSSFLSSIQLSYCKYMHNMTIIIIKAGFPIIQWITNVSKKKISFIGGKRSKINI